MPAHCQNKKSVWLTFITAAMLVLLSACAATQPSAEAVLAITPTETIAPPTATPEPVAFTESMLEPALLLIGQPHSELPVNPPVFEIQDNNLEMIPQEDRLIAEYAQWYRLYKSLNPDVEEFTGGTEAEAQANFEQAMEEFKQSHPEISVIQKVSADGTSVVTLLHDTKKRAVYDHFTQGGALAFNQTGMFDENTTAGMIVLDPGAKPELMYNSEDGLWYLFQVKDAQAVKVFIRHQATVDNLFSQWKELSDGKLDLEWDGSAWVEIKPEIDLWMEPYLENLTDYQMVRKWLRWVVEFPTSDGRMIEVFEKVNGEWRPSYENYKENVRPDGSIDAEVALSMVIRYDNISKTGGEIFRLNQEDLERLNKIGLERWKQRKDGLARMSMRVDRGIDFPGTICAEPNFLLAKNRPSAFSVGPWELMAVARTGPDGKTILMLVGVNEGIFPALYVTEPEADVRTNSPYELWTGKAAIEAWLEQPARIGGGFISMIACVNQQRNPGSAVPNRKEVYEAWKPWFWSEAAYKLFFPFGDSGGGRDDSIGLIGGLGKEQGYLIVEIVTIDAP